MYTEIFFKLMQAKGEHYQLQHAILIKISIPKLLKQSLNSQAKPSSTNPNIRVTINKINL